VSVAHAHPVPINAWRTNTPTHPLHFATVIAPPEVAVPLTSIVLFVIPHLVPVPDGVVGPVHIVVAVVAIPGIRRHPCTLYTVVGAAS